MKKILVILVLLISLVGCKEKIASDEIKIYKDDEDTEFEAILGSDVKAFEINIEILKPDGTDFNTKTVNNLPKEILNKDEIIKLKFGFETDDEYLENFEEIYKVVGDKEEKISENSSKNLAEEKDFFEIDEENSNKIEVKELTMPINQKETIYIVASGMENLEKSDDLEKLKQKGAKKAIIYSIKFYNKEQDELNQSSNKYKAIN